MNRLLSTAVLSASALVAGCLSSSAGAAGDPCTEAHRSEVTVATASQLTTALANARPGVMIRLRPGTYVGRFKATVSGTSTARIALCGPREAILDAGSTSTGYGLHLSGVKYWVVSGFTVRRAKNGVMLDRASYNRITGLLVHNVGEAGIHVRRFSSSNVITLNEIRDTGRLVRGYGEGIYVGTAVSNWPSITGSSTTPDRSNYNKIRYNAIGPGVTAEHIDIKEGTTGGIVEGNTFDGTGLTGENYADSWMDVKGNNYTIQTNTGFNALNDGFQTHVVAAGWGRNNVFANNIANVNGPGFGFNVDRDSTGTIVKCTNRALNAARGLSNQVCAP